MYNIHDRVERSPTSLTSGTTMARSPWYAYAVAILLGLVAAAAPAALPLEYPSFAVALLVGAAIFGIAGLCCGALWSVGAARWGVWIVAPGLALVVVGLISSGEVAGFLTDDLPFLVAGFLGATAGAIAGGRLRGRASDQSAGP